MDLYNLKHDYFIITGVLNWLPMHLTHDKPNLIRDYYIYYSGKDLPEGARQENVDLLKSMSSNYANYGVSPPKYKCCHSKTEEQLKYKEINFDKILEEASYRFVEWEVDLKWDPKFEIIEQVPHKMHE